MFKCPTCGGKLVQTAGWFIGKAVFECPKCDAPEDNITIITDRYSRIPPIGGVSNGVIIDNQTGKRWTEKNFIGTYNAIPSMIHQLNGLKYNDIDNWRLPTIIELIDLVVPNIVPTTNFPGMKMGIYFAGSNSKPASGSIPIVDFSSGNTYHVSDKTPGTFKLIQD